MSGIGAFFQNHFLNAGALWWLAALAPLIIILYFLKLKRQELTVSSTLLWLQSIEDLRVNSPFQTIRRNILLLLQLLILLLAVLALARPLMNLQQEERRRYIVLIDTSASMAVEEMDGTRLEAAKKQALELVENMLRSDQMALIRFAAHASVLSSFTSDSGRLRELIEDLEIQATETNLREALNIGFSLAKVKGDQKSRAEVHLFSDGRYADTGDFAAQTGEVNYHAVGTSGNNVGLVALDVGYSSGEKAASEIFYGLENFDAAEAEPTVEFYFNDQLIEARKHKISPKLRLSDLAPVVGDREGVLKIRLVGRDVFPLDDTGYAVIQRPEPVKVLLIGPGDYFFKQALAVGGSAMSQISPDGYTPGMAEKYDVVVFDSWAPEETGRGSFIFHNCHPKLDDLEVGKETEGAMVLDWDRTHPLMRFFSLAEVFILRMKAVSPPKWMKVLAQTTEGPMLLCSEQENFRALYLPFHMSGDSNLSAQGTFPIFVLNALRWLPTTGAGGSRQLKTGDTLIANVGRAEKATVTDPKGRKHSISAHDGRILFPHTNIPGIYKVEAGKDERLLFAVNLLSPSESNVKTQEQFKLKGADLRAEAEIAKANREIWHWLVLGAFFMLLFEWYVYNAKVYL